MWLDWHFMRLAKVVERVFEVVGDEFCRTAFNVMALEHVYQLTIFEQRDARR